jgi:formylglycine-generating enzyme required for sulfatase activity
MIAVVTRFALALTLFTGAVAPACAVTIDWATVGDPGNAADTTGYGRVDYEYDIGKHHITIEQYCEFLNAVAKTDAYGVYDEGVNWAPVSGISRNGTPGSYTYTPTAPVGPSIAGITAGNRPITKVTWFTAARFTNWMANGQPTGPQSASTTERGTYTLDGKTTGSQVPRNSINPNTGAAPAVALPTEDEWYKPAYYKGGGANAGYWNYATRNDTPPGNDLLTSGSNVANYWSDGNPPGLADTHAGFTINPEGFPPDFSANHLTAVGMFAGTVTAYGVYDMSGNARSWLETPVDPGNIEGTYVRGGHWDWGSGVTSFSRTSRSLTATTESSPSVGIRLVAPVPEPSAVVLAAAGLVGLARYGRRCRTKLVV